MKPKHLFAAAALFAVAIVPAARACTGITLRAADGSIVLSRTIEWSAGPLHSEYVVIPRGHVARSLTPDGTEGMEFTARYGAIGLTVVQEEFVVEGINEAGLSAGLFYFPHYGSYPPYDAARAHETISDLQLVAWLLAGCATVQQAREAVASVRIVSLDPDGQPTSVHWRVADAQGDQIVIEVEDGVTRIYDNELGVLTNSPGFEWQITNLNNYVNLRPGNAEAHTLSGVKLAPFGAGSGMLGLPGDFTPPSRFVRAAFLKATAPVRPDATQTVLLSFHLLNNFDVPIGIVLPAGATTDLLSATQWTTASDVTHRKIYYRTAGNPSVRCIDLSTIDFGKVAYQVHPLDTTQEHPIETIRIR